MNKTNLTSNNRLTGGIFMVFLSYRDACDGEQKGYWTVVKLSAEQIVVANHVMSPSSNILVRARAGTGKTFLLMQCLPLMHGEIVVAAYSTKIAQEIREKIEAAGLLRRRNAFGTPGTDVGTFHALGWAIILRILKGVRLEGYGANSAGFNKYVKIFERLDVPLPLHSVVHKAMERAMERGFGIEGMIPLGDQVAWLELADHYALLNDLPDDCSIIGQILGIRTDNEENTRNELLRMCLRYAAKAIVETTKMAFETFTKQIMTGRGKNRRTISAEEFTGVISFTEMMYLPLRLKMPFPQYDWVTVDEAQDSNPLRREMARRMLKPGGHMLWVGDNMQAIFGFTGADNDALDKIVVDFNCTVLPMTFTYRCAKAIVRYAAEICPDYKAAEENPEGLSVSISENEFEDMELVPYRAGEKETGDAIICRNTAPLVKLAYKLYSRNVPCHIEGREVGRDLLKLLDRWSNIKNLPALVGKLNAHREKEVAELMAKKQESGADKLSDQVDALLAIIDGMPNGSTVETLRERIEGLFSDTPVGEKRKSVTLLTIHRSKGLEFTRAFNWGNDRYLPSRYAIQDWQLDQELHLDYVSRTRAIMEQYRVVVRG